MTENEELKPCPFCGCEGILFENGILKLGGHRVECSVCYATVQVMTRAEAITAWNRRARPATGEQGGGTDKETTILLGEFARRLTKVEEQMKSIFAEDKRLFSRLTALEAQASHGFGKAKETK